MEVGRQWVSWIRNVSRVGYILNKQGLTYRLIINLIGGRLSIGSQRLCVFDDKRIVSQRS